MERKTETQDSRGRALGDYQASPPVYIRATLCGATPEQQMQYHQIGHPVSHVISHEGSPVAKPGDRLVMGNRAYYVRGVDNPGEVSIWTIYYCEERGDAHDGNQVG